MNLNIKIIGLGLLTGLITLSFSKKGKKKRIDKEEKKQIKHLDKEELIREDMSVLGKRSGEARRRKRW